MSEMTFSSLKSSHQIRDYEEKKTQERRRNLLYLVAQFLKDEGYFETLTTFTSEAHLSDAYQICDNIDLTLILQDFESYYFVRFQKYPKICKKTNPEEGIININKKLSKLQTRKPVPETGCQPKNKPSVTKVPQVIKEKKPLEDSNCLSVVSLGSENVHSPGVREERRLKPLGGLGIHNTEWLNLAEMITKDIVLQDLNIRWSDIMGLDEAKRLLKEAVVYPIKYPELFKGILTPWKGLLLFGAPGTGKTLLAKAVATQCKTTFFNITASSIVSKWRGDSEKLVRVMFDLARYHAPSTIFLDELDALASKRDGSHHSSEHEASRRLKTELLIQLDGLAQTDDQVFFLATSNLPWCAQSDAAEKKLLLVEMCIQYLQVFFFRELDPAILRRLEKRILVDIPNENAREAMFRHFLPEIVLKNPVLKCDIFYEFLAKETEGYSGSDIKLVCKETAMQAVRKVFQVLETLKENQTGPKLELQTIKTGDVQAALEKTKPSASHLIEKYKEWQDQFGSV